MEVIAKLENYSLTNSQTVSAVHIYFELQGSDSERTSDFERLCGEKKRLRLQGAVDLETFTSENGVSLS